MTLLLAIFFVAESLVNQQGSKGDNNMEDVVYSENADIVREVTHKQVTEKSLKIHAGSVNVSVLTKEKVAKTTKERPFALVRFGHPQKMPYAFQQS